MYFLVCDTSLYIYFISRHISEHIALSSSSPPLLLYKDRHYVVGTVGKFVPFVIDTFYPRREIYML